MADQSDVESVLVGLVAAALYPNGPTEPSVPGPDCRIYRGWPQSAALDADLSAGKINVTVFPSGDPGRVTSRYSQEWFITQTSTPGLTITVDGNTVTLGGTADPGQLAGILVNDQTYVYRTQEGDSAELVAANLATLARADQIVLLSGATLTIPGAAKVVGRVVADVPVLQEVRRQEQTLRITCWCPTPATRDSAASVIDQSLARLRFIDLPDGTQGRLSYSGTNVFDQSQDAQLYRRDLLYSVEYATTINELQPAMLFGNLVVNAADFTA